MIAASDFLIEDDTAWWIVGDLANVTINRCDTCGGSSLVDNGSPADSDSIYDVCPDCIGGRRTFEIEVDCRECGGSGEHDTGQGCWACQSCDGPLRVTVVEVLPIVEWDGQPEGIACLDTLGNVWYPDIDREGEPVHYLKDRAVLPESAAPGQWAVRLKNQE